MCVTIETNDLGPWAEDAEWVLTYADGSEVRWANGSIGPALSLLQKLPGFDNAAVVRAMQCTDNERFVVWQAAPGAAAHERSV